MAGKTYSFDIFVLKGVPYKDQIEELFIVIVLFYVFLTCNIVNFIINFTFLLQHIYQRHSIAYLC